MMASESGRVPCGGVVPNARTSAGRSQRVSCRKHKVWCAFINLVIGADPSDKVSDAPGPTTVLAIQEDSCTVNRSLQMLLEEHERRGFVWMCMVYAEHVLVDGSRP